MSVAQLSRGLIDNVVPVVRGWVGLVCCLKQLRPSDRSAAAIARLSVHRRREDAFQTPQGTLGIETLKYKTSQFPTCILYLVSCGATARFLQSARNRET